MLRSVTLFLLAPLLAMPAAKGAIWPDHLAGYTRTSSKPLVVSDRALWGEYGLNQAEQAEYVSGNQRFDATAWQLKDSTGALGAFDWQRPADARPSKLGALAAETKDSLLLAHGNYLLQFTGWKPQAPDLEGFLANLPSLDQSPLPTLRDYLPHEHLIANSERYVIGPAGLDKFDPKIPPSVAAFHLGAEAQLGSFQTKSGPMELAVFSYPTPQIAILRVADFQKLPGAVAKRSGPLVAVVLAPPDPDAAERLLSAVRYQATITWNERVPTRRDNVGDLIVNIFILIGILLIFFTVAGLAFGFLRRWLRWGSPEEPMILLHLEDRAPNP